LLLKWGLGGLLGPLLTSPRATRVHNFNGEILAGWDDYAEEVLRRYGSPFWTLHRVDLQCGLTRRAIDLGVQIQYSCRVIDVDSSQTTITFSNGEKRCGDLVVVAAGAVGLSSMPQRKGLAQDMVPQPAATGYMAYRITVDCRQVCDKGLLGLASSLESRMWVGQDSYALCYPIRGGTQLSVLLVISTKVSSANSTQCMTAIEELRKLTETWDPL
jgi:salicylate hydroxylase